MSPKDLAAAIRLAKALPKPPPVDTYGEKVRTRNRECMRRIRAAKGKPKRLATLTRDVNGQFTNWKAGQMVYAVHVRGSSYAIERLKWEGQLPLCNSCCNVPRSALRWVSSELPIL